MSIRPCVFIVCAAILLPAAALAQQDPPVQVGGAFPHLTVMAPGVGSRTEAGIGALMPWADRLWMIGYVAHVEGQGLGLYEIDEHMRMKRHPASVTGTFANRLVHWPSEQAFIGPHAIDARGNVRTIEALKTHRLTATALHLEEPRNKVYFLTMEGLLFEVDVRTLESKQLFNLVEELRLPQGAQPHFKAAFSAQGRLIVANNTYDEAEHLGRREAGRLAEWDGRGPWRVIERSPFIEVWGKMYPGDGQGNTLYALGWDNRSAIFRVLHNGQWQRYRLPKASHSWSHTWNTEWMRIRDVQTERYVMDAFGLFYDLPGLVYGDKVWGIKPIATHLRIVPDLCYWRGMLVLAGDQTDHFSGQPQSGLWFGQIDDLWKWGKPAGWGGVWRQTDVRAGDASDPYLMTGFDRKTIHLTNDATSPLRITVEVDFLGDGSWRPYTTVELPPSAYAHHVFPDGYSAHWVRLVAQDAGRVTGWFFYE